jgi:hypothetical protein
MFQRRLRGDCYWDVGDPVRECRETISAGRPPHQGLLAAVSFTLCLRRAGLAWVTVTVL